MTNLYDTSVESLVLVDDTNGVTVIPQLSELRRLNWFDGKLLRADDLRVEQDHMRGLVRRANSAGGRGVVHGLTCTLDGDGRLHVGPGVAVDPGGRSLVLPVDLPLDVQQLIDATAGATASAASMASGTLARVPVPVSEASDSVISYRATKLGVKPLRTGFSDCVVPGVEGQPTVGAGRWYVITVAWAEGLCGNEEVYGRLCEDACTTSTDRPWRMDGLVFRARPIVPRQALATSRVVGLDARHERSLLASALFADERDDGGSMIFGDGLRSGVWCSGAAPDGAAYDDVPIGVIARAGQVTTFLDIWTARRERIEPPPRRYWAGRMAMRPWDVFLAQVLQFQCQLTDLLEHGPAVPTPIYIDPCAERQRVLEQAIAELANRPPARDEAGAIGAGDAQDAVLELLRKKMISLRLSDAGAGRGRVLIDGGIVELPPAGYLPVDPIGPPTIEAQVQALVGPGVDLTFCTTRADAVARALEDAQHLDRISLLSGLDAPARHEDVEIIVPDAEIQDVAARDGWRGRFELGANPDIPNAGGSFAGAGRVETTSALALRWAGRGSVPSKPTKHAIDERVASPLDLPAEEPELGDEPEAAAEEAAAKADAQADVAKQASAKATTPAGRKRAIAAEEKATELEAAASVAERAAFRAGALPADTEGHVAAARDRLAVADARVEDAHDAVVAAPEDAGAAERLALATKRRAIAQSRLKLAIQRTGRAVDDADERSAWLEATIGRDPLTLGVGESMSIDMAGDMTVAPSRRDERADQQDEPGVHGSFNGAFVLVQVGARSGDVLLVGSVSGTLVMRTVSPAGGEQSETWSLDDSRAEIQSTGTADGGIAVTLQLTVAPLRVLSATLTWHGTADDVGLVLQLARLDLVRKAGVFRRSSEEPRADFGEVLAALTLRHDPGAATSGDPARESSERALDTLEHALHRPGYAAAARRKLFPQQDGGIRLRATRDWVLFRRRAVLRCGPIVAPPVALQTFAVYGLGPPPLTHVPMPTRLGDVTFALGSASPVGSINALADVWDALNPDDAELAGIGVLAGAAGGDALSKRRAEELATALATATPLSPSFAAGVVATLPVARGAADGVMLATARQRRTKSVAVAAVLILPVDAATAYLQHMQASPPSLEKALDRLFAVDDAHIYEPLLFREASGEVADAGQLDAMVQAYRDRILTPVEVLHVLSVTDDADADGPGVRRARGATVGEALDATGVEPELFDRDKGAFARARQAGIEETTIIVVVPERNL